jgi:hypothetical protein
MNLTLRRIVASASALAVAGAMTLPIVAGSTAATATVRPGTPLSRIQIARQFLSHLEVGQRHPVGNLHAVGGKTFYSDNWSGYADTPPETGGSTYSAVSGSWVQPAAKCPSKGIALAALWVGLDGFDSNTVEQTGTIIECDGGQAGYFDWWELYPTNDIQVVNTVNPGDAISASVAFSGITYTITLADSTTTSDSFSTAQTCGSATCENSSAEWIAEAPCCKDTGAVYNLADFGKWKPTGAAETYNGTAGNIASGPKVNRIDMVDASKKVLAEPSGLTHGGTAFTDTWKAAK